MYIWKTKGMFRRGGAFRIPPGLVLVEATPSVVLRPSITDPHTDPCWADWGGLRNTPPITHFGTTILPALRYLVSCSVAVCVWCCIVGVVCDCVCAVCVCVLWCMWRRCRANAACMMWCDSGVFVVCVCGVVVVCVVCMWCACGVHVVCRWCVCW